MSIEVRIHGRAGQGALTAARLLAGAAWRDGWHPLAFPHFGAERTGAPMNAYVRLARGPVRNRSRVLRPDLLLVLDPSLLDDPQFGLLVGVHGGTLGLVNAEALPEILLPTEGRWLDVPASRLAVEAMGQDRANVPLLGALAALEGPISIDSLETTIEEELAEGRREGNLAAVRAAYQWMRSRQGEARPGRAAVGRR